MIDESDQEIDVREYVEIAIKRKRIVLGVFAVSVVVAVAWSACSPKLYEVSVLIGPPIMTLTDMALTDTGVVELDSIGNMKAKIDMGIFNARIIHELNIPVSALKLTMSRPRDASFLKVSVNRTAEEVDVAKKMLAKLVEILSASYEKSIEGRRKRIARRIKLILSRIDRDDKTAKATDAMRVDYADEIVRNDRTGVENLELAMDVISNVQMIREPFVSQEPIGPAKKQRVLLAGFVGLIAGLFAAFVAEYWENPRRGRVG